jgi:hypothetical protein
MMRGAESSAALALWSVVDRYPGSVYLEVEPILNLGYVFLRILDEFRG